MLVGVGRDEPLVLVVVVDAARDALRVERPSGHTRRRAVAVAEWVLLVVALNAVLAGVRRREAPRRVRGRVYRRPDLLAYVLFVIWRRRWTHGRTRAAGKRWLHGLGGDVDGLGVGCREEPSLATELAHPPAVDHLIKHDYLLTGAEAQLVR